MDGGSVLDGSSDNSAALVSPWYFNDPSRSVCKAMVAILEKEERGNEMEGRCFLRVKFAKMLVVGSGSTSTVPGNQPKSLVSSLQPRLKPRWSPVKQSMQWP